MTEAPSIYSQHKIVVPYISSMLQTSLQTEEAYMVKEYEHTHIRTHKYTHTNTHTYTHTHTHTHTQVANLELSNCKEISKDLTVNVTMQNEESQINYKNANNIKRRLKAAKISSYETKLDSLRFSVKQKKRTIDVMKYQTKLDHQIGLV